MGAAERYADFFEFFSETQECNRWLQIVESRLILFHENYYPSPSNLNGTVYDFINSQGGVIAETLRLSHNLTQNCLIAVREEIIKDKIVTLFT